MSFLDHIHACNAFDPTLFRPFEVGGQEVGRVLTTFAARLAAFPHLFVVKDDRVQLADRFSSPESRTDALRDAVHRLGEAGVLPKPKGEDFAVVTAWGQPPLLLIDRNMTSAFGIRAFGVHMNGFVRTGGRLSLWIGTRAADKSVAPGKFDNMVAGGQPAGLTLAENLLKEAAEEADIPAEIARQALPVGAITYCMAGELGLKPDTLFVYDLEVPTTFTPRNTDGEIAGFTLMDVDDVANLVRNSDRFKFNVNLVIIDFLIRHGRLSPDTEPDYLALVRGLRAG